MPERHDSTAAGYQPWLHRFARLTAVSTFFLIVAGALVTSKEAGLSVPDWPLSYGSWMPPMVGGILFEHGHRMIATFVGFLTTVLALWLWRWEARRWLRRLGFAALGAVILQGVLGGLTVLYLLPWLVSVAHAALAQLFFCGVVSIAIFTGTGWRQSVTTRHDPYSPPLPHLAHLALLTSGAVLLQLLLGAAFRHKGLGILPHMLWASAVTVLIGWTAWRVLANHKEPALRTPAMALLLLVVLQLGLGMAAYLGRVASLEAPQPLPWVVGLTVAHVAAGALTLAVSVVLTLQAYRLIAIPGKVAGLVPASGNSDS